MLLCGNFCDTFKGDLVHRERSFFGVLSVERSREHDLVAHDLLHGTTLHGKQMLDPSLKNEPLTYYHRTGPLGNLFREFGAKADLRVAAVGLGTGSLAAYLEPGQAVDFYEIDPAVVRIARNPRYFTFLQDSEDRGVEVQMVVGDARLKLSDTPPSSYDLIVVDAFSSDAIPVHLLTNEALALYRSRLREGGVVAFHISNRYLDLEPVLARLAESANLEARIRMDTTIDRFWPVGKRRSTWCVLTEASLKGLCQRNDAWREPNTAPQVALWEDDFSNILRVIK
jgi:SAM-dependent methyltransferase